VTSQAFFSGGGRGAAAVRDAAHGDARPASSRDTATAARIARIRVGILTVASKRICPPQRGQASASISNARLTSAAHAQWREVGCPSLTPSRLPSPKPPLLD